MDETPSKYTSKDITIPVPWGHIAGKRWSADIVSETSSSSPDSRLLMIHGIQDNCGSFNPIIRTLQGDYDIVAVDLPSHGFSSHFPSGLPIEFVNFVQSIKRVVDYLGWSKFTYIGHSFGGQLGTYFAGIYPEYVSKLIVLDTMGPRQVLLSDTLSHLRNGLDFQLALEKKLESGKVPVYSYKQALEKLTKNRPSTLTDRAAKNLIERCICPSGSGFRFTSDQRLKNQPVPIFTFQQQTQIVGNISCCTLYILADQNMQRYNTYLKDIHEFNSQRKNCRIVMVEGNHDVHQNYPERVNFILEDYLTAEN